MRLGPVLLLLALLVPACGEEGDVGGAATRPDPTPDAGAWEQVALLSGTAAGGSVSEVAVPLPDEQAVTGLTTGLDDRLAAEVAAAAEDAEVPEGHELYGAVVSIGCDVPPGVMVRRTGDDVVVEARPVKSPLVECLAPVTTVALVSVAG